MKYEVRLEFKVSSIDILDVEVEANSREEAIRLAEQKYYNSELDESDRYASDYIYSELDVGNMDIIAEEVE